MKSTLIIPLALMALLAACSSDKQKPTLPKIMYSAAKTMLAKKPDPAKARRAVEALSREQLTGLGSNPVILVDIEISQQYASLFQISENNGTAVFISGDQKTLSFSKGLLSATRGLGADLMSLDMTQSRAALQSRTTGPRQTRRIHRMLDGEGIMRATNYDCTLRPLGTERLVSIHKTFTLSHVQETCRAQGQQAVAYTNDYWLDPRTKVIWKSRQWAGPVIGYLGIEVLIPENS